MNIEEIRKIPITDFLARMGHEPTARKGNEWWYSAPYREERTPSFRVNILKNVWQDFGIGRGGDIFSLAGELQAAVISRHRPDSFRMCLADYARNRFSSEGEAYRARTRRGKLLRKSPLRPIV